MKNRKKEWFDDAWYWRKLYPFMFQEKDMAEVETKMAKALKLAKPPGKTALDLCCGEGRYSIALAKRKLSVTGVDKTKYLLDRAREKASAARVPVEWVQADMRDFLRAGCFDLVLSMFSSFGYFADTGQDVAVLANIHSSLKPSGVLLIDLRNGKPLEKLGKTAIAHRLPDGSRLVERREKLGDSIRTRTDWFVKRNGRVRRFSWNVSVYSSKSLQKMLKDTGFRDVKFYGSLDGEQYGSNSQRLIAVARKPAARN
jgi:SAM-dependent methyltransferase